VQPAFTAICGSTETSAGSAAQSFEPIHISKVAEKLQLGPDDYNLYGMTKAKARSPLLRKAPWLGLRFHPFLLGLQQVKLSVLDRLKTAPNGKYGERSTTTQSRQPWCVPFAVCRQCASHLLGLDRSSPCSGAPCVPTQALVSDL
jgi:hypothetical protein